MRKIFFYFILVALSLNNLFAESVDSSNAKLIAKNFYYQNSWKKNIAEINVHLSAIGYQESVVSKTQVLKTENQDTPLYYVFNINNNEGFVIVSAEDNITPVLGYSLEGGYDITNLPPALTYIMNSYNEQIIYIKQHNLKADIKIQNDWKIYSAENYQLIYKSKLAKKGKDSVLPLVTTKWNQNPYYNAYCPSNAGGQAVTGCVATAMAQIMRYWKHPVKGKGQHTFYHPVYGQLSANFDEPFDWDNMPSSIGASSTTAEKKAVGGIAYKNGVSLDMDYSPGGSSTTNMHQVIKSLADYYYYAPTARFESKDDYDADAWLSLLKEELLKSRPMQVQGWGPSGGHAWVLDGFNSSDYLHYNLGWGGSGDGYFISTIVNPKGYDLNYNVKVIMGIEPIDDNDIKLELGSNIIIAPDSITYNKAFTVTTGIKNTDANVFKGSFAAYLYDSKNNFYLIDTTDILTLDAGASLSGGLTFTSKGIPAAIPGTYRTGILYRPLYGNWLIADTANFKNMVNVKIVSPSNQFKLKSNLSLTTNPVVENQTFNISGSITNTGDSFTGDIAVVLYSQAGDSLLLIGKDLNVTVNSSLDYAISFKSIKLSNEEGPYLLSILYRENNKSWLDVKSTGNFVNPFPMLIIPQSYLTPDKYEPNNSYSYATKLVPAFNNDNANVNTEGSNIGTSGDFDYYKIVLDSGYRYSISTRLHDKDNALNGQNYTTDVSVSYRYNKEWSDYSYPTLDFEINEGGTVYFVVKAFFASETGTYLLDVNINRIYNSVQNFVSSDKNFLVYPNPASDKIYIDLKEAKDNVKIGLYSVIGQLLFQKTLSTINNQLSAKLDISSFNDGIYMLKLSNKDFTTTRKIIIKH